MKNTHTKSLRKVPLGLMAFLLLTLTLSLSSKAYSHGSCGEHVAEAYEVLGFYQTPEISEWLRFISQDMIDGYNREKAFKGEGGKKVGFYDYLKFKYPDFKCKHRLLFHWGYNSRPWNDLLQKKVEKLNWSEEKIKTFQQEFIAEQKRRNANANAKTEDLFGFAHGGREASMARALISIAYDVHLLGDYTPDNSDLDGLSPITSVIGDLINNLRTLDQEGTKELVKSVQAISRKKIENPIMAEQILTELKKNLRGILRQHPDKRISKLVVKEEYIVEGDNNRILKGSK